MRWINRGSAPAELADIARILTPKWIEYHEGRLEKPKDTSWRIFRGDLSSRFFGACGYCEEIDRGEVDHFRPKSKFPKLVYAWSNWIFACHSCNAIHKKEKWPPGGYVDPCARSKQSRPEQFFDFNLITAEIITKDNLAERRLKKACQTIRDLKLNDPHHLKKRIARVELITMLLMYVVKTGNQSIEEYMLRLCHPQAELGSISRAVLAKSGYPLDID